MNDVIPKYERINCCKCNSPCAWAMPNQSHKYNVICNLCRLDEWIVLRWLGIVTPLVPTTAIDEEKIRARWQLSLNLDTFIRESKLPEDAAGNLLNVLREQIPIEPADKTEQQLEIDALAASLNF